MRAVTGQDYGGTRARSVRVAHGDGLGSDCIGRESAGKKPPDLFPQMRRVILLHRDVLAILARGRRAQPPETIMKFWWTSYGNVPREPGRRRSKALRETGVGGRFLWSGNVRARDAHGFKRKLRGISWKPPTRGAKSSGPRSPLGYSLPNKNGSPGDRGRRFSVSRDGNRDDTRP